MLNIHISDHFERQWDSEFHYSIGGMPLRSSVEFTELNAFKWPELANVEVSRQASGLSRLLGELSQSELPIKYQGRAPFNGGLRTIEYRCNAELGLLSIDGEDAYCLDTLTQTSICLLPDPAGRLALELLLGPVTVLFFIEHDRYCLHAGCVQTPVGLVGLLAESGVGKSTLSASAGEAWRQVCDDVLVLKRNSLRATGAFPQLKLPTAVSDYYQAQHSDIVTEDRNDLVAFVRLGVQARARIEIEPLAPRDSLLQLVRHSVGAKLLNAEQLQKHTLFCAQLASKVPMWEIAYPRDLDELDQVRATILETVSGATRTN